MLVNSAILIPVLRWTVPVSTLNGPAEIFNREARHGEQARYSTLLSGPIVIVFHNYAELFISSSLLPENIFISFAFPVTVLPVFPVTVGIFFGDASANFPRAINSSRVDAFTVSVGTRAQSSSLVSSCAFGNGTYFYRLFRIALTYFFRFTSERYCSTWNIKCKTRTFLSLPTFPLGLSLFCKIRKN